MCPSTSMKACSRRSVMCGRRYVALAVDEVILSPLAIGAAIEVAETEVAGCSRKCRVLYFGSDRLRCRRCLGLRYRCQLEQPGGHFRPEFVYGGRKKDQGLNV